MNNSKGLLILCLSIATLGVNEAWGAWSGSGQGKEVNGVWYALYDNTTRSISPSLLGKHVEYNYKMNAPGSTLTFSAKRSKNLAVGELHVAQNVGGSWSDVYSNNPGTEYESSGSISLNVNATELSFYNDYGSYERYFKDVHVVMAKYIDAPSATSLNFETSDLKATEISKSITIAWCNVPALLYDITGSDASQFEVNVANNAEEGFYNTATFTVKYKHDKHGIHSAKLVIASSDGNYRKEISLSGATRTNFYATAYAKADPAIGGGTWISLNGYWPTSDENYQVEDNSTKKENTTTAPTFSAQYDAKAKDGYEFVGWYTATNGGGTQTSSTARYTEKFTVSSVDQNAPTTITRYANFKDLPYFYFKAQADNVGTGNVYASFTDDSFSSASDTKTERATTLAQSQSTSTYTAYFKAEETDPAYHFVGWYTDAACTEANRLVTELSYSEQISGSTGTTEASAKTITRYAKFVQELTPEVTSNYSGSPKAMFVEDEISSAFSFLNTSAIGSGLSVVSSNNNIITYDAANNKVIAKNEGTATLTFTQTKQGFIKAGEFVFTFSVSKIANTLTADASHSMKVDETWSSVISNKNSDGAIKTTSTDETIAYYDVANNKIVACNSNNQSFDSVNVTITIDQEETYKYTAASETIEVKVEKYDNIIYVNNTPTSYSTPIQVNGSHAISITSTNEDYQNYPFEVTQTQGDAIASINAEHTQISVSSLAGAAMWTITQSENYKYKAGYATINIEVQLAGEATDCYVLNDNKERKWGTIDDSGNYGPFDAAGTTLYFEAKRTSIAGFTNSTNFYAQYSTDGSNWTNCLTINLSSKDNWYPLSCALPETARYVRFETKTGATGNKHIQNVRVTRKTYLTANDLSITTTSTGNSIYPGESGSGTITINRSLANGGNLHISWDNPKFTINGKTSSEGLEITETDCTTGTETLNVVYTSNEAGEHEATVTINNAVYSTTCTLKGTTKFSEQTITWKDNIDILTAGTDIEDPASSTVGNVTYTSSDETVISVEGNIIHALKAGKATITAFSAGNAYYADTTEQKEITVTDDKVQYIVWNQSFMNLKIGDSNKTLEAFAQSDVVGCTTNGARLITFTSNNESVVKIVNNNQLQIMGIGTTTITATQAGGEDADGHTYIAASVQKKVVVRDPNAECVNYIYIQEGEWRKDLGWNLATNSTETYEIDFQGQEPGYYNVDYKGESHDYGWPYAVPYYNGQLYIDQLVDNNWVNVKSLGEPTEDQNLNTGNISLNRKATKMRFRVTGKAGYFYFKDCTVTLARYLEATNTLNKFEAKVGAQHKQTLSIKYSNIEGPLTLKLTSGKSFSINMESIDGDCGSKGAANIEITYFPSAANEEETDLLTITDDKSNTLKIDLIGSATKTNRHIVWNQEPTPVYTLQTVTLTAEAQTDLNEVAGEVYYTLAQNSTDVGNINGNTLSFTKYGNATVVVNTISNAKYTDAVAVSKTWTVNLTPTQVITKPTIGASIVSGTSLSDIVLEGGAAQNTVNNQAVEGIFAVTSGETTAVGEQTLTVTFTPNNTDMYEGCTTTITANVVQREATAEEIGTPSAAPITYGSVINTSALSGSGSLAGTWSWMDEDANKATPNVGIVNGLNVIFTPNDGNVKPATMTVSLTVTAATPTLAWTAKAETAQVHETKTFTASSTNTDNTAAITYSIISGDDCATIDASTGEVTMLKAGTITIKASQAETTNYNSVNIETTCTISVAPTTITTAPTTDNIVSGTSLNEVILTGGEAQNTINNQAVAGTFAVTAGNLVNVGEQTLTITFTPNNTDMYEGCTTTITATIVPRTPTNEEVGTPSATDIDYGNPVNTSELTGNGTLAGTWSWSDTRKDDILNAGTYDDLQVHFVPEDNNYNEADATVSLTVNKAAATLNWETAPTEANVQDQLTYKATSNHLESAITYSITAGSDCATINANTGALTITKAGTITVQASQAATTNYEAAVLSQTTTLTGEFETVFIGNGDWNDLNNWTHGLPTSSNPDVVISGNMTIDEPISVGSLTIEANGSVTIEVKGDLTVNGESEERDAYGDLFVHNGGNVTIGSEASVTVHDFVIEASIGTQNGTSQSGQVDNGDKVIYTNGAYIDINMDPTGHMVDAQWYGFTVPFPVDVQNGVARKEGDVFRKCTYGKEHMIAEYDMDQRKNTGKGWKYIKSGRLQPGHFYYFTANVPDYNVYRFKAADNTITIQRETQLAVNGEGPDANWNAVGNTTLTYATISGESLPEFVQTYVNGESRYIPVKTNEVQFVVGCPFFVQATASKPMVLNKPTETNGAHYAPRQTDRPICVRIAEEGKGFSDQMYITASEDAQGQYQMGRDLAKAGVGTKSAQLWINAYNQQLCVNDAPLVANQAFYDMSLYIPKAGNYEISLPTIPTNGILYLTQEGYPIWNLNDAPYVIESGKGTNTEYGLMFDATQAFAPTDAQTISGNDNAQKILKEQSIYIYKNGNIFNVTGQKVK